MREMLLTCLVALVPVLANAESRPNVIMLLADDLGYQDIGCYDGPVNTPTLDSLAAQGTRFQQFLFRLCRLLSLAGHAAHRAASYSNRSLQLDSR